MEKKEYKNMYQQEDTFWWYKTLHNLIISTVKQRGRNDLAIFDAGCGTGRVMELLQKYGTVSGIDYSEEAIYFSNKRGLKNAIQTDLNTWIPSENETFDVITSIDVLYHKAIENEDEILQKFYQNLKKGGILILNLPAFNILKREHDKVVFTKKRYLKKPIIEKLKKLGFEIEKATYRMPHLFFIILVKKLIHKIFPPKNTRSDVQEASGFVNSFFSFFGNLENKYLLNISAIPVGSSLFIVAKKIK